MMEREWDTPEVNLGEFIISRMRQYGDSKALVNADTGVAYTYSQLIDRCQKVAKGLRDLDFKQGDVLGLLSYNSIEYPVINLATLLLGGILQPLSPGYTDVELEGRFRTCQTRFLITTADQGSRIARMIKSMKHKSVSSSELDILNSIIILGDDSSAIPYASLLGVGRVTEAAKVQSRTTAAILLSSSGTTGLPKAVQLSHYNVVANIIQIQRVYGHTPGMVCLAFLPMYHHFGAIPVQCVGLCSGTQLVVMPQFHFHDYLRNIERYKAEILHMVPPVALRLVKEARSSSHDLSSVKVVHSGAAPLSQEVETNLLKLFNIDYIGTTYGLTETGCITGGTRDNYRLGSTGKPTAWTHYKVLDTETGLPLGRMRRGELCVKGPQITIGYLNNPEANKAAFDADGFMHTGDIGYIDNDGFVFVVDRLKELVKYKGLQVAPAELENLLLKHPDVQDAAVVGISDQAAGELPKAYIVKKHSSNVTGHQLRQYVDGQVSSHMRLRGGVEFIAEIPKSPSGKILRRLLRQRQPTSRL